MSVAPARPSLWPLGQDVALQRHHVGSGVGNCAGNRGGAPGRRILRGVLVWRSSAELWVKDVLGLLWSLSGLYSSRRSRTCRGSSGLTFHPH